MSIQKYNDHYYLKFKQISRLKSVLFSWLIDSRQPVLSMLRARFQKGSVLLDFGCGVGNFAKHAATHFDCTGIDISKSAIHMAKKQIPNAQFIEGDVATLTRFKSNTFDVITCFDVLEHLDELDTVLHRFYALLKSEGQLIVGVPVVGSIAYYQSGKNWIGFEDKTHVRLWSRSHWVDELELRGFSVYRFYSSGIINSPTSGFQLRGWLQFAHYIFQILGISGLSLPPLFSDEDYYVCIKNPHFKS